MRDNKSIDTAPQKQEAASPQVLLVRSFLVHPGGQPEAEIKYAFHRSHWGQGFATEAASALLAYGASHFGRAEVIATTAPENEASHRVLLKAGMQRGALRENDDGTFTQFFVWHPILANPSNAS